MLMKQESMQVMGLKGNDVKRTSVGDEDVLYSISCSLFFLFLSYLPLSVYFLLNTHVQCVQDMEPQTA